jgi:hypothetical protein
MEVEERHDDEYLRGKPLGEDLSRGRDYRVESSGLGVDRHSEPATCAARTEGENLLTNVQFYFAIGLPSVLALVNIGVMLTLFLHLGQRMLSLEQSLKDLTGAVNELDKRLTRVEIKIGIQS